jgi:alpha-glucuronidase
MRIVLLALALFMISSLKAEDGYDLWLRYHKITNNSLVDQYKKQIGSPVVFGSSPTILIIKNELTKALTGLTGSSYRIVSTANKSASFIAGISSMSMLSSIIKKDELDKIGTEGFIIKAKPEKTIITANTDIGLLYGVFHFSTLFQRPN